MKTKQRPLHVAVLLLTTMLGAANAQQAEESAEPAAAAATDPTKDLVKKINDATGLEFWGYARGGFYSAPKGAPKGGYALGGDMQKFRLGNEGDNYLEFGIGKKFDLGDGIKWGVFYMPKIYNGESGTAQMYTTLSGLSFAPSVTFWAGQRYRRLSDIHILDRQMVEDGDNYGAGADGIPVGGLGKLNVAIHNSDSIDNKSGNPNNAKRLNFQWIDIPTNPGGTLTVTGGVISGDFAQGRSGGALGLMHKQKDLFVPGLNNTFYLQGSTGHASITGKFYNLDNRQNEIGLFFPGNLEGSAGLFAPVFARTTYVAQPGAKQHRIADAIDFQFGRFGGQALIGYQTLRPDNGAEVRDLSVGGRLSYGIAKNVKLLGELGSTRRSIDGQAKQTLNKGTIAVALSPNTNFWTRPEFRVYVTRASWNGAAALANADSFGANGRRSATLFGVQMEAWWE